MKSITGFITSLSFVAVLLFGSWGYVLATSGFGMSTVLGVYCLSLQIKLDDRLSQERKVIFLKDALKRHTTGIEYRKIKREEKILD